MDGNFPKELFVMEGYQMSQATDILDHIDIKTEKFKGVNKFGKPFCCARYTRG